MAADQGAIAAGVAPVAPAPVFALTPALVGQGFLDWTKHGNSKLHQKAIEKLSIKFEGKADQILLLGNEMTNKANQMGFERTIMNIPDENGTNRNLIKEHGLLSYPAIETWATANIIGQQTRAAQDNSMMYQCLFNTVSETVKKKLIPKTSTYMINNEPIAAMYYKAIISTAEVETKATVAYTRINLVKLKERMQELKFDVTEFHSYTDKQITTLASHGKTSDDLTVYLFEAYATVPDKEFKDILSRKSTDYHMGAADLTHHDLMRYAQSCYDVRVANTNSPWMAKSTEELEIEALNASVQDLRATNNKIGKALQARITKPRKGMPSKKPFSPKKGFGARANTGKYAWKDVVPKSGDPKTMDKNGKTYHWCPHHKAWTLHTAENCRMSNESEAHDAEIEQSDSNDENEEDEDDEDADTRALAAFAAAVTMEET